MLKKQLELGIDEMVIYELVGIDAGELSNEELIKLEEDRSKEVEAKEEIVLEATRKCTTKKLSEVFATVSNGMLMLEKKWTSFMRNLQDIMGRYRMLLLAIGKYIMKRRNKLCGQNLPSSWRTLCPLNSPSFDAPVHSTSYSRASSEDREIDDLGTVVFP